MDTPGMYVLKYLRCKDRFGASLCDIAILLVDIMDGLAFTMYKYKFIYYYLLLFQTMESLKVLTGTKTPFVVALSQIDRYGVAFLCIICRKQNRCCVGRWFSLNGTQRSDLLHRNMSAQQDLKWLLHRNGSVHERV